MIDKLTKKQEAKVPVYLKKWLDNGRSTKQFKQAEVKKAIADIYSLAGHEPPKHYFFFPSPLQAQMALNIMRSDKFKEYVGDFENLDLEKSSNLESNLWSNLWSNLRSNLGSNLWSNLGSNLRSNLESNLESNLWSNLLRLRKHLSA